MGETQASLGPVVGRHSTGHWTPGLSKTDPFLPLRAQGRAAQIGSALSFRAPTSVCQSTVRVHNGGADLVWGAREGLKDEQEPKEQSGPQSTDQRVETSSATQEGPV